jgi:hypothetical protein
MIEKHYLKPNHHLELLEWMETQMWYVNLAQDSGDKHNREQWGSKGAVLSQSLITTLTPEGTINLGYIHGPRTVDYTPRPNPYNRNTDNISGVWRQCYGWDDESTKRRAPLVWELFDHVNNTFFNNKFTLDGHGEGIRATRVMWQDSNNKDLPDWGKFLERGNSPAIWTSYANGRPNGMHCHGALPNQRSGAHMDSDGFAEENENYYTILINLNPEWNPTSGGEVIFHEALHLEDTGKLYNQKKHWRRNYQVGMPSDIIGHEPGLVLLYSSEDIHRTIPNTVANNKEKFQQKIAFRVRIRDNYEK